MSKILNKRKIRNARTQAVEGGAVFLRQFDGATAWREAMASPAWFADEQAQLQRTWTFLGLTTEVARDDDWIARDLWGRAVFVQRFGDALKGFENRCVHRFYPLRTAPAGNGPIRCGFHGWHYDRDGATVGIPMCREFFGATPRQIGARLAPVEIATCGQLIFGRFGDADTTESLADYLGDLAPILQMMSAEARAPRRLDRSVNANWKLTYHITLEDYHIVAVHPSTFGKDGPLRLHEYRYYRRDPHSAMLNERGMEDGSLTAMAEACAAGTYQASGYRIFHIFPNLVVLHIKVFHRWYVLVMQYLAVGVDRTVVRTWYFPANFATVQSPVRKLADWVLDGPRAVGLRYAIGKIVGEDNAICEGLQQVVDQVNDRPLLGREEERIAWFEEAYARVMRPERRAEPVNRASLVT